MIYNEDFFKLSIDADNITNLTNNTIDEKYKEMQKKLLKILLEKFKVELELRQKNRKGVQDGILKIELKSPLWGNTDLGYNELHELIISGNFDSFARDYCMYLGNKEDDSNFNSSREIIWDYKTYFEELKETGKGKEAIKAINDIKKKEKYAERNAKKEYCKINGHDWSPWKEIVGTKIITDGPHDISERHLYEEKSCRIQIPKWQRKCNNCGCTSTVETKPKEIKIQELEEQIKRLKRKKDTRKQ